MFLILPSTLLLASLIAGPALYHAFVVGDLSVTSALARFLIAVPVAAIMTAALRWLTASYRLAPRQLGQPDEERADADRS